MKFSLKAIALAGLAAIVLGGCQTSKLAKGPNGGCLKEDFVTQVSGGEHCLEVYTQYSKSFDPDKDITLIFTLHGDGGPGRWEKGVEAIPEIHNKNIVIANIRRPGYGLSTGYRPRYGSDSYTEENIRASMEAAFRLKAYYENISAKAGVVEYIGMGNSGGSNMLAAGSALHPTMAPDKLVLTACNCDFINWFAHAAPGKTMPGEYVSAINIVSEFPVKSYVYALTGSADSNTLPKFAKGYVEALKKHGVEAEFIEVPEATHANLRAKPEFSALIRRVLSL